MSETDPYARRRKNQTVEGRINNSNEMNPNLGPSGENLKNAEEQARPSGTYVTTRKRPDPSVSEPTDEGIE